MGGLFTILLIPYVKPYSKGIFSVFLSSTIFSYLVIYYLFKAGSTGCPDSGKNTLSVWFKPLWIKYSLINSLINIFLVSSYGGLLGSLSFKPSNISYLS